jgi:hypothetical protein
MDNRTNPIVLPKFRLSFRRLRKNGRLNRRATASLELLRMKWIMFLAAGLAALIMLGGHEHLSPQIVDELLQFIGAAAFTGAHVLIWSRDSRAFRALRALIWVTYGLILGVFLLSFFPRGIIPVLGMLVQDLTVPLVLGFISVAIPAIIGSRRDDPARAAGEVTKA